MSDFTSSFWDFYVGLLTVVSIVGCAVFLKHQSVRRVEVAKGAEPQTSGHLWDEDLREYNNPLPRWWAWLFYLTLAFGLVYVVLYPGLGSYRGLLGWSQIGQLEEENARAQALYGPLYAKFAAEDVVALVQKPDAIAAGQKLFLNHCAQCHASDGAGSRGFPNLTDRDWLWGGTPEAIRVSIAEGRTGVMPPFGEALGPEGVKDVAHFVLSLSGSAHEAARAARGREKFAQLCAACHGAEGRGNVALGAPDLTDRVWLHGSGEAAIVEIVSRGRTNQMPAHKDLLAPEKIHLLTAYVLSLSRAPK